MLEHLCKCRCCQATPVFLPLLASIIFFAGASCDIFTFVLLHPHFVGCGTVTFFHRYILQAKPLYMYAIPGLENYPGCKGGSGVYQKIISLIPPHETLIIPFLGHCAITRFMRTPNNLIAVDKDLKVITAWRSFLRSNGFDEIDNGNSFLLYNDAKNPAFPGRVMLQHCCGIEYLDSLANFIPQYKSEYCIYADPPYVHSTRKDLDLYKYEMSDKEHLNLTTILLRIAPMVPVIISGYENDIYNDAFFFWNKLQFGAMSRGGKRTETVYYSHSLADGKLHDYSYLGKGYKDRERIKLKIQRHVDRLAMLPPLERNAIIQQITGL